MYFSSAIQHFITVISLNCTLLNLEARYVTHTDLPLSEIHNHGSSFKPTLTFNINSDVSNI